MKSFKTILALFAFVMLVLTGTSARAATITWGGATNVDLNTPTQVSTLGAYFDAVANYAAADVVVNGVTFHHRTTSTVASTAFNDPGPTGGVITNNVTDLAFNYGVFALYAPGANNYGKILSETTGGGGERELTITGLIVGRPYQVQVWMPFIWTVYGGADTTTFSNNEVIPGPGVTLNLGLYDVGVGQFVAPAQFATGTFTADATTQGIAWHYTYFAAMQVRAIPEPNSLTLLGLGSLGMIRAARRRQR